MFMITVCENFKRFTGRYWCVAIKCWAEFFVLETCKYLFTVQGFHLFHWYSTERTITSKHVSDSRQVIFLQRSDQRLG